MINGLPAVVNMVADPQSGLCLGVSVPCTRTRRGKKTTWRRLWHQDPLIAHTGELAAGAPAGLRVTHLTQRGRQPLGLHFLSCDLLRKHLTQHSSTSSSVPWSFPGCIPGPPEGALSSRMHSPRPIYLVPITCFEDNPWQQRVGTQTLAQHRGQSSCRRARGRAGQQLPPSVPTHRTVHPDPLRGLSQDLQAVAEDPGAQRVYCSWKRAGHVLSARGVSSY